MAQEVGRFFRDLRQAFGLTHAQVAARLSTRADIILALEEGQVRTLPPWSETARIVRTYAGLAGLDPRPALQSIEMLLAAEVNAGAAEKSVPASPMSRKLPAKFVAREPVRQAPPQQQTPPQQSEGFWHGRHGRAMRLLFAVSVPIALIVLVTQTAVLEAAVAKLPPSVARIVRGAQNYVIVQMAPVKDGLRWIDVPDPRSRRGDKLQTASQSD
jgi:transcriptional regulator with XRE-family HTH domain